MREVKGAASRNRNTTDIPFSVMFAGERGDVKDAENDVNRKKKLFPATWAMVGLIYPSRARRCFKQSRAPSTTRALF
jgi:hypothetical protein